MWRVMDEGDSNTSGSMSRARSVPLSGARREAGNPFWSDKARAEWELARARPVGLPRDGGEPPVPEDDFDNESRHAVHDQPSEATPGRARREVAESRVKLEKLFITPGSWSAPRASEKEERRRMPVRSQGPIEETLKTEGTVPQFEREKRDQGLKRELEKTMVDHLFEENRELKRNLMEIQRRLEEKGSAAMSSGGWSEVGTSTRVSTPPPPPPPYSPRSKPPRFTPNGTQVPAFPPRAIEGQGQQGEGPPMPPWPYVTDESGRVHEAEEWKAWQNNQIREVQTRARDPVEATEPSPSEARMMGWNGKCFSCNGCFMRGMGVRCRLTGAKGASRKDQVVGREQGRGIEGAAERGLGLENEEVEMMGRRKCCGRIRWCCRSWESRARSCLH